MKRGAFEYANVLCLTSNSVPMQDDSTAAFVSAATGTAPVSKSQSPMYRTAVDYVGSVKKAYETSNPRVYADFLESLEKYHSGRYEDFSCITIAILFSPFARTSARNSHPPYGPSLLTISA